MRSGNGRHRRPRQAPALLVTAGMTGAGIAMPLLGASAASAADTETWDRVADCESGGLWSANSDNGYYGGLQLTLETWEEYGGTAYAERPDLASRSQQITVAEEIFEDQGPNAWPSCSMSAGLTEDSTESPDVDPGGILDPIFEPPTSSEPDDTATPTPTPTPSQPETTPTDDGSSQPSTPSEPSESTDPSESAEPSESPGSSDPSDADSPGSDASEDEDGESPQETGTPTPEQPAEGSGKHRGPADEERSSDREERSSRDKQQDGEGDYRVRSGDSLSAIAAEQDVEGGWPALYEANREVVGGDPDLILPGQRLEF